MVFRDGPGPWELKRIGADGFPDRIVAPVEIASSRSDRRRGLLGRDGIDGVLAFSSSSVHTVGMRFAMDVAYCHCDDMTLLDRRVSKRRLWVVDIVTMKPHRIGRPRLNVQVVLEAEAGQFEAWKIARHDSLEIVMLPPPGDPQD